MAQSGQKNKERIRIIEKHKDEAWDAWAPHFLEDIFLNPEKNKKWHFD